MRGTEHSIDGGHGRRIWIVAATAQTRGGVLMARPFGVSSQNEPRRRNCGAPLLGFLMW
jgi:hypothetical protein